MKRRHTKNKDRLLALFGENHLLSLLDIAKKIPDVDFSTLYRNTCRFIDDGILREVMVNKVPHYELTEKENHPHFVCRSCKDIQPIHLELPKGLLPKKMIITSLDILAHGICEKCEVK